MRPTRRMLSSSSGPFTRPTGAVVFCCCSAFTTSVTETLNSRSFSACSSTESSRLSEPVTFTDGHAVDGAEAVGEHVLGQARDLRVALRRRRQRQLHHRLRRRVDALQDRLAHLDRQLVAHRGDGVADLVRRLDHVLLEVEDDDDLRAALGGGASGSRQTCGMLCSAFSTRLTISRSTVSGEAPGYGIATMITGCSHVGDAGSRAGSSAPAGPGTSA